MNTNQLRTYRFKTRAQWDTCQFAQTDRSADATGEVVRPFPPFARPAALTESPGAHAPVVTRAGEIIWLDDDRVLHRLSPCHDIPELITAPEAFVHASRIVATSRGLWVITGSTTPNTLELYDSASFTRLLTTTLPGIHFVDIASDGRDSLYALVEENDVWKALSIDYAGHATHAIEFQGLSSAEQFVFLKNSQRFVVLTSGPHPKLEWYAMTTRIFSRVVAGMRPCFRAHVLGSDSRERVFLAGRDDDEFGGDEYVLTFDSDGDSLGDVPVDPVDVPITGVTGNRQSLLATGKRGLLQFRAADVVPEGAGPVRSTLITPLLFSPDREDQRRWLRIEAKARVPEGATLEIAYASADTNDDLKRINDILNDTKLSQSHRVEKLLGETDLWNPPTIFAGSGSETQEPKTFPAKLFDEHDRHVIVSVSLTAASGAHLPALYDLNVLYPGHTLMENLPAIYQVEETKPDSFLRSLVGVLETTTQDIDDHIGAMGSLINPQTAPPSWLNFIARWIGVPWDDALTVKQKQAVITNAPAIAKARGTRAGLEALLEALIPGSPRRFRVKDASADFGFAVVGGESCAGSTLPAMLGGFTRWHPLLNSTAKLGAMRLPCANQFEDGVWQLAGRVRVEIAATRAERNAWEQWLPALLTEMIPLTARLEIRWVTARALRTNRLDGTLKLESPPEPHLGTDAITDLARLPEAPVRLSACGEVIGTRLR